MRRFSSFLWALVFLALSTLSSATAFTVKAGGGGNFTTIQACSTAAVAGDTCTVFAGTYAGWTQSANGSSGSPITFQANAGDAVVINSTISLSSHSFITIGGPATNQGFDITVGTTFTTMSHVIIQNNHVHNTSGRCFGNNSNVAATFNQWLGNTIEFCGGAGPGQAQGFLLGGNNNLIDGNIIRHVEDGLAMYGDRNVVRNNHFGPLTHAEIGTQHPDTVESAGTAGDFPLTHLLYEGNIVQDWGPDDANSHVINISDINSLGVTGNVFRFNSMANLGSYSLDTDRNVAFTYVYNNSVAFGLQVNHDNVDISFLTGGGCGAGACAAPNSKAINNITTNTVNTGGWSPVGVSPASQTGFVEHNNMVFTTGYSGSWKGPHYTGDSTNNFDSTDKFNQNPLFVNPGPTNADLHLQAGSPAIGAGGPLTTAVGAGSSSTALTVVDAGFFQDGYGISSVQADWIRLGASTTAQISAINYSTNVITLANPVTWANGASIYLYKKSDGSLVLNGTNPDVGAFVTSSSANYYVNASTGSDSNNGLAATTGGGNGPWLTLQHANSAWVAGISGTQINVAAGGYSSLDVTRGGPTITNRLRYVCTPGTNALTAVSQCRVTGTVGFANIAIFVEANSVDIVGFDIGNNVNMGFGIVSACNNTGPVPCPVGNSNHAIGNYVHDLGQSVSASNGATGCPEGGAIQLGSNQHGHTATDPQALGNWVKHFGTNPASTNCNVAQAIYLGSTPPGSYAVAQNNLVTGAPVSGLTNADGMCNLVATNNTFINARHGIVLSGNNFQCTNNAIGGLTIANNAMFDNTSTGAAFNVSGVPDCSAAAPTLWSNNISDGLTADFSPARISCDTVSPDPWVHQAGSLFFVNYQADGSGDYHLKSGSAGIAAGSTTCASGGPSPCTPSTDLTGTLRPGPLSVGAFDVVGAPPPPHVTITPSTWSFGTQAVNTTGPAKSFNVLNDGGSNLLISSITSTGDFLETNSCFSPTLSDTFSIGTLNASLWAIDTGNAPGNIAGVNAGTFSTSNVDLSQSVLALKVTQSGSSPVNSVGAEVRSINTFGYGDYKWRMRASSTATTPGGVGSVTSGQISSAFTFINNSQTEIDSPEIEGQFPNQLEWTNWSGISNSTASTTTLTNPQNAFHDYEFVWGPGRVDWYVDNVWAATHTTNVPTAPAFALLQTWGTNSTSFGGLATVGTTRWTYFSNFVHTPSSGTLAPGFSCTVNVAFRPSSGGAKSGTLVINDNASGSPHTSSLSGIGGTAPVIAVSPSLLAFGIHTTSTTSSLPLTISNPGTAPLIISGISITGVDAGQFSQTNACTTIAPNGTCTVSVSFSPTSVASFSANLQILSNDPNTPTTLVALSGTGRAPAQVVSVSPSSLVFGPVAVGSASSLPLTIRNTGGSTLTISGVAVTGAGAAQFSQSNGCITLATNSTCTITVTFTPLSAAAFTANIQITSDDPVTPAVNVALTGTGVATAPLVSLSSNSFNFSSILVGATSAFQTLTITNPGNADLVISARNFSLADYSEASGGTCGTVPITITTGLACTMRLQFAPSTTGTRSGSLSLVSNAASSPTAIALTGIGIAPAVSFSPSTVNFGNQPINSTSNIIVVTLTNPGTATLNITTSSFGISGANFADFTLVSTTCPSALAAGNTCTFTFNFHPTTIGAKAATFSMVDTASGSPHTLALVGNGSAQPHIQPAPNPIAFGSHTVGTTSTLPLNVTNTGTADLLITGVSVTGMNANQFSQVNACGTIVPNATCVISVSFSPTLIGALSANVQVVSNDPNTPTLVVSLTGTGTAVTLPIISPSATSFDFSSVLVGTMSSFQTLTLTNTGTANLVISAEAFTNSEFSEASGGTCTPLPVTVAPSASCTIRIQFAPSTTGTRNGLLNITNNASGTALAISLTGIGIAPAVSFSPTGLNFGNQTTSTTSSNSVVTLTNTGTATLGITIGSFGLSGPNASDFTFVSSTCSSTLPATNTCTFTFNFHPATAGTKNATFSMVDTAAGSPHTIPLTGTGINAPTGVTVIIGGISAEGGIIIQ